MKNHIYARDVEKDVYYKPEESKPEFEESIAERTKMRKLMKRTKESDEKIKKYQDLHQIKYLHQIKWLVDYQLVNYNEKQEINEIRQLLYSLYHSKNMTKTIYKHLTSII